MLPAHCEKESSTTKAMITFWCFASLFFNVGSSQEARCDTVNCPSLNGTSYDSKLNCGYLVNDGSDGRSKKCVYLMKTRSKWPESNVFCSGLKLNVNGTEVEVLGLIFRLFLTLFRVETCSQSDREMKMKRFECTSRV